VEARSPGAAEDIAPPRIGGHYVLRDQIGAGGMATVYLGYDEEAPAPRQTVAIKRLHPWLLKEPELVATLLDEGRLVSHVAHPNVVSLREVVVEPEELFLVLEYVQGEPLSAILRTLHERGGAGRIPAPITCALIRDLLRGLHAAHEARDERGRPLGIVHRDVSPQNVIVGVDGLAHLLDFGVAKAAGRSQSTRSGTIKGKLAYMAPEQLRAGLVTRRSDVYAASIVFWEMLAGRRIFGPDPPAHAVIRQMQEPFAAPSTMAPGSPASLDAIVLRGLAREPLERFGSAAEMADAIESAERCAAPATIAAWLRSVAGPSLQTQGRRLKELGLSASPAGPESARKT
jgi:serine/threonine protein kinase